MNWLDIVIIAIVVVSAVACLFQGAIRTVFGIAGILAGIFLAGRYYEQLAILLSPDGASWSGIAAYAIILFATLVAVLVVGWIVARIVHLVMLGWLDKLIGFVLGAGLGAILCAAILIIVSKYSSEAVGFVSQSALAEFLMAKFPLVLALLPQDFNFVKDIFQ